MKSEDGFVMAMLLTLIGMFDKNIDTQYIIDNMNENSLSDFIFVHGEYLLETLDYIETYHQVLYDLNSLEINGMKGDCDKILFEPQTLILLIELYKQKKNNEMIQHILYRQRWLLNHWLGRSEKYLSFLLRDKNNLSALLDRFREILRYEYKIRKKNVKRKVLVKG